MTFTYETRDDLVKEAKRILANMHAQVCKAGVKREWNRFIGSIPSKNDVKRAAVQNLQSLNDICTFHSWDPVYKDEDEAPISVGQAVDQGVTPLFVVCLLGLCCNNAT